LRLAHRAVFVEVSEPVADKPLHNSGAELDTLTIDQIRAELRESFPGGTRWTGLTYALEQRVSKRRDRLIKWTLAIAILTLIAAVVSAWPVLN
jgi:hypothetical protein